MEGITCTCHVTRCNRFRHALARRRPPRAAMELSDMGPDLRFEDKKLSLSSVHLSSLTSKNVKNLAPAY